MKECATCDFLGRPSYKSPCSECRDFSKWSGDANAYEERKTNADRIRSMSDEELAKELALIAGWDRKQYRKAKMIGVEKFLLNWLKLSSKENIKPAEAFK